MDVRQFAFLVRQPSAALKSRDAFLGLPKRGLALILANALFWQPLLAQAEGIVVSAPGTTVGAAGNGVPVVNIATPNGSGLSHNQFKDYNVGANGVILNNATERTQSTQLGGLILGNPNLQGRAANIILNEVNGGSPSQLRGYTEVAGQSAKVIVANPYGITCSGCGFINTPNVTLTTGKPILDNGRLDRYQVDGGAVTIDGQGLDAGNVDHFEIITRSAKINAQINARNLSVIAGRNDVNAQTLTATARADDGSAKPELAIDSTALGGMYAGAIKLVGTEAGVGVKLDGALIASGGDIQLDANGQLKLAQAKAENGAIAVNAASVLTQGAVHGGTTLTVQSRGDLNNQSNLSARDHITLSSGGQLNNRGIIESGVNLDLSRNATGDISLSAQSLNNTGSSVVSSRKLTVNAAQALINQGGTLSAKQAAHISAGTLDNQNKGRVLSSGGLELNANQWLNAQGGLVTSSGPLTATVGQLSNRSGEVSSLGVATLNITTLDNVAGIVTANQGLRITASGAINNQGGKLTSLDTLNLTAGAVDNSAAGRIASNQALAANVASLNNNAGQLTSVTALTLDVNKGQLSNQNGVIRGPILALNSLADVDNQGGEIASAQSLTFTANSLDNTGGKLLSDQALTLRLTQVLNNVKGLVSANGLDVRAASVNNSTGTLTSDASVLLTLDGALTNTQGEVSSANATQVQAASLDNSGGKVTGDTSLNVDVRGALNNRQGVLATGQTASITAASLDNSNTGKVLSDGSLTTRIMGLLDNQSTGLLTAKGAMDVQAGSLDNRGGSLSGKDLLTLNTASLDNRGGKVSADKDLQLNATQLNNQDKGLLSGQAAIRYLGAALNNQGGLLSAVGPVRIDATSVENASGRISSQGDLTVNVTHFNQQKGELVAQGNMSLTGSTLDNSSGGLIGSTKALTLTVDDINNQAGEISSAADVNLTGTRLNNSSSGKVLAGTNLGLKVAQVINQSAGLLFGKGQVTLQGHSLDNSGGTVSGQQGQSLTLSGDLNNTAGLLTSEGAITATTAVLNNMSGTVSSAGAIALSATGALTNQNGAITTDQGLILNSASLDNRTGTLSAKGAVSVTTGAFDNTQAGRLISNDTLTLTAGQVSNGKDSRIASDKDLLASVKGFDQQGGQLFSKTSLSLDLNNGQLNNQQGLINAPLLMLKNLSDVNNQGGEISSVQAFTLASKSLDNSNGKLISNQALTLRVDQALNNIKGLISAAALQVQTASLDNSGGLISSRGELGVTVDGIFNNQNGSVVGDGNVQLASASLDNTDGQLSSKGDLTANVATTINHNGALVAQGALSLTGQRLDNRQNGFVGANQRIDMKVGEVDNRSGEISSKAAVALTGQRLDNSDGGLVLAATSLKLDVDKVLNRNKGQLSAQSGVSLAGASLDNSGGSLVSQKDLGLNLSGELNNTQGRLSSEGLLSVNAAGLINRKGSVSSAGALSVTTAGAVDNQGGEMVTDAGLTLRSASLDNGQKGTLSSTSALNITTGAFDNSHAGNVSTSDTLTITAGQLTNHDGGRLTSNKALTANVTGLDQQGGKLFSNTSVALDLKNGQLNNQGGLINGPLLMLKNLKGVNNQGGEISSAQAFTLTADSLDNSSGKLLSYQALTLRITQALNNVKGLIAAQSVDGRAATLDNSGGTLTSRGDTLLNVDGQLTNQDKGLINAANALTLNSAGVDNQGGSVLGKSIAIDLGGGDLNNTKGLITTEGQLTIKRLRDLSNQSGEISTAQNLTLNGRTLDNSAGKLISNTVLTLDGTQLTNQGGLISGWQGVSVNGVDLDNRNQGTVSSRFGNVDATLSKSLLNSGAGALVSQKALTVKAANLDNSDKGILSSAGGQTLTVTGVLKNAGGGLIDSGAALDLNVHTLNNAGGTVNAQQALGLIGTSLDNSAGNLIGNGSVTLDLLGALTNADGKLASAGALLLKRATEVNNQGGQLVSQSLLTLFAGSLDNRKRGTVASNGTLLATTTGAIQNDGDGLIYSQNADLKLKAASLDNAKGSIQSQTALNLDISGALDNQSGKVIAQNGAVDIKATSIDNRGGTLASLKGTLQAKALGGLLRNDFDLSNNRQAGIIQAQSLILTSASLNNNGGRIAAQIGDTDVTTGAFDNRDGGLYAKGTVKVIGSSFDNSGDVRGQVAGGQVDLKLSGGALNNQKGIIESDTTLKVEADSVDNQGGQLRALGKSGKTDFQIGGVFDNRNGVLETANSDLTLNAGTLKNKDGSVLHVGIGEFDISMANLTGAGGNLLTRGGLTLTADEWTNSSVIQAGRLTVNVKTLSQTAEGQLLASDSLVGNGVNWSNDGLIASDGSLNVTLGGAYSGSGRATSQGTFGLSAAQVNLTSTGRLAGGGITSIDAGQLTSYGRLTSNEAMTVKSNDLSNFGTLGAAQDLTIRVTTLGNEGGLIFSGRDMDLLVNDFTNQQKGAVYSIGNLEIAGVNGGRANEVNNLASSINVDGDFSLSANSFNNKTDGIVGAEKFLSGDIRFRFGGTFYVDERYESQSSITGERATVSVAGNLAAGVGRFTNTASLISAGKNITLNVDTFENLAMQSGAYTRSRVYEGVRNIDHLVSERGEGPLEAYARRNSRNLYAYGGMHHEPDKGGTKFELNDFGKQATTRPNSQFGIGAEVAVPAQILAGSLKSDVKVFTDGGGSVPSIIQAGQTIDINAKTTINNSSLQAHTEFVGTAKGVVDTQVGKATSATVIHLNAQLPADLAQQQVNPLALPGFSLPEGQNGLFRLSGQGASQASSNAPQSWVMGASEISVEQREKELPLSKGADISALSASRFLAATTGLNTAAQPVESVASEVNIIQIDAPASGAVDPEIPNRNPGNIESTLPPVAALASAADSQAINRVQTLPDSQFRSHPNKYLIETNPALTDLKQFMSSDYLLSKLGYNPDDSWKRLGDGFYEQKLIQQAVVARTGQHFLAGMNTDEKLFKYLMDNAIQSKQQLNLAVGVSLSAAQVAALTHDIVWLEKNEVNGEQVLVPVLYLAQANNRLGPNGALIAANDINLIAGENLTSGGTLRAARNLSAAAGQNLVNSGLIEAGGRIDLLAGNNLVNKAGGIISGRDVKMTAINGDVINERTVNQYQTIYNGVNQLNGVVDSAARIEAANNLSMGAGRDVSSVGGVIRSGADTVIRGGRDVNVASAQQVDSFNPGSRNSSQTITQYGSTLEVGRDLSVVAGRDINAIASQIDAKRDVAMAATENLLLSSAADEQHSYSKKKKVTRQEDHVSQVSTTVTAGGDVSLSAGKDMALISSRITAGDEAYLVAGGNLDLLAAQDSDYSLYDRKKKSGLGGKQTKRDEVTDVKNIGSEIKTGGDLTLESGGDQKYQVAKLESGKDLSIASGGEISFEGVKDLHQESHEKSKSSLVWNSSKGKGNTDETLRQTQLVAQGNLAIKAVDGLKIDIKQIDQQTVSQTIDVMVKADPQLAWLKEAEKRGDVDWRQVREVHESFKYSNSSLGQGAMLAIIIVVTVLTAGAASAGVGTLAGATAGSGSAMAAGTAATAATAATATTAATAATSAVAAGWGNVMASAVLTSVASNSAVSFINNGGNIGATFKDITSSDNLRSYATGALTAGFTASVLDPAFGVTGDNVNKVTKGFNLSSASDVGKFAAYSGAQGAAQAGFGTALQGGSLGDNLKQSLVSQAQGVLRGVAFNAVGDFADHKEWDKASVEKTTLHALVGGLLSEAAGEGFVTGAMAAGANEALSERLSTLVKGDKQLELAASQLVGLTAAAIVGGDLQTGIDIAKDATAYNRQLHPEEKRLLKEKAAQLTRERQQPTLPGFSWEELLTLASDSQLDNATAHKYEALRAQLSQGNQQGNPLVGKFSDDMAVAQAVVNQMSAQGTPLRWKDGSVVTAYGKPVIAFQATAQQKADSGLFAANGAGSYGPTGGTLQADANRFGVNAAVSRHPEISVFDGSSDASDSTRERVKDATVGGLKDVTLLDVMPFGRAAVVGRKAAVTVEAELAEQAGGAVLRGSATYVESKVVQANTTVQLSETVTLANGNILPKGSVVTVSDDAMKVVYPDGVSEVGSYSRAFSRPLLLPGVGAKGAGVVSEVPQITLNRQNGTAFERQVVDAFNHVGGVKNTTPVTVQLPNGAQVTTIPDLWGKNVGGLLEVKNVQNLSMSNQLRAQIKVASDTGQPLNLVVSPRTSNISGELMRQVRNTGGDVFRYNPATGDLTRF
ncbi:putative toxin [Pseudomonas lactis]|uniref:Adhesin/hemagglutinin, HecA family n=1 Tax=Pseudomonas lactis TaxID=1615674 RepID=I4K8F8_9PSED|nr:putative toxin [Pseudomonas lactis]EIK60998.1 adhesin/hemagglutinin, HecA family [Pseudomonas lactis]